MAKGITATAAGGSLAASLVASWELRAGAMDTVEWLDGAADTTYPGGGPGTFSAVNSDGANGYDPAPKMAIINLTTIADGNTVTLAGDGITAITAVFNAATVANSGQTYCPSVSGLVITLEASGTVTTGQLMVLYS